MTQYKQLMYELKKEVIDDVKLIMLHKECAEKFPIGHEVKVLNTGYIGKVHSYNSSQSGFYSADRYPICVQITHSDSVKFRAMAVGRVFEYGFEQLVLLVEGREIEFAPTCMQARVMEYTVHNNKFYRVVACEGSGKDYYRTLERSKSGERITVGSEVKLPLVIKPSGYISI